MENVSSHQLIETSRIIYRGIILLSLKLCGFKTPQTLKYGIWEWSKL